MVNHWQRCCCGSVGKNASTINAVDGVFVAEIVAVAGFSRIVLPVQQ